MEIVNNYKTDFGIDAPHIIMGMIFIATFGFIIIGTTVLSGYYFLNNSKIVVLILVILGVIITLYGLFMASYMTYSSKIGKLKTRELLFEEAEKYIKWENVRQTLDIGCGRGLFVIGAAKRITNGISIGIDIWSNDDQSNNSEKATIRNVEIEEVVDKVKILTANACKLPFSNDSMDIVMSH